MGSAVRSVATKEGTKLTFVCLSGWPGSLPLTKRHDDVCYGTSRACRLPWATAAFGPPKLVLEPTVAGHEPDDGLGKMDIEIVADDMPADVGGRATCGAAWLSSTIDNFTQDSPSHLAADTRARDVRFAALAAVILAGTAFLRVAKAQDNPAPRIESNTPRDLSQVLSAGTWRVVANRNSPRRPRAML